MIGLPNDERAAFDAYHTPYRHALALTRWTALQLGAAPRTMLEPAAGGGAWLVAARHVWPQARLTALDIQSTVTGLELADRRLVGNFIDFWMEPHDVCLGNPPYRGDLRRWIDRSRELSPVVGYLLRSTFLGALDRLPWWQSHPPSDVVVVLPRPKWEGEGARSATDTCDSVFVLWRRGHAGSPRLHWLDVREAA